MNEIDDFYGKSTTFELEDTILTLNTSGNENEEFEVPDRLELYPREFDVSYCPANRYRDFIIWESGGLR